MGSLCHDKLVLGSIACQDKVARAQKLALYIPSLNFQSALILIISLTIFVQFILLAKNIQWHTPVGKGRPQPHVLVNYTIQNNYS